MTKHKGAAHNTTERLHVPAAGNWSRPTMINDPSFFFATSLTAPPLKRVGGIILSDERHLDSIAEYNKGDRHKA